MIKKHCCLNELNGTAGVYKTDLSQPMEVQKSTQYLC